MLMILEYFFAVEPASMGLAYVSMLVPLLILRFFTFHKKKQHYFMLDFCYYMQAWTFQVIFWKYSKTEIPLLRIYFALVNGPLLLSVIMWNNTLVFHDMNKLTSLLIHIGPPLFSYCLRWKSSLTEAFNAHPFTYEHYFLALFFYSLWQILYLFNTKIINRKKFEEDLYLVTSARWLSGVEPHPIWNFLIKKYPTLNPEVIIVVFQFIYTMLSLSLIFWVYSSQYAHFLLIFINFLYATWTASVYYFDVFAERYSKKLEREIQKFEQPSHLIGSYVPPLKSFLIFLLFFCFVVFTVLKVQDIAGITQNF